MTASKEYQHGASYIPMSHCPGAKLCTQDIHAGLRTMIKIQISVNLDIHASIGHTL